MQIERCLADPIAGILDNGDPIAGISDNSDTGRRCFGVVGRGVLLIGNWSFLDRFMIPTAGAIMGSNVEGARGIRGWLV